MEIDCQSLLASQLYCEKGFVLGEQQKWTEAIQNDDKAIEIDNRNQTAYNNKGFHLAEQNNHTQAIECYDKALEIDSRYTIALTNKGISMKEQDDYTEAMHCYDEAIETTGNPQSALACRLKGNLLKNQGRHIQARECYDKAAELDPESKELESHKNKANEMYKQRKHIQALEYYQYDKVIKLDPRGSDTYAKKGDVLRSLAGVRDHDKIGINAEAVTKISLGPNVDDQVFARNSYPNRHRGTVYSKMVLSLKNQDTHVQAIKCYDKAIELNGNNVDAYFGKALILFQQQHYRQSVDCLENVLRQNPTNTIGSLCYLYKRLVLELFGSPSQEILATYDQCLKRDPRNEDPRLRKHLLYSRCVLLNNDAKKHSRLECALEKVRRFHYDTDYYWCYVFLKLHTFV